mmetsp:Transcript_61701/g.169724  ORF Transcript_61701/g.169724 Transcript_61701/m.169724 type:complete len:575 (-) Transcript_61701:172-1896(-)
MPRAGAGVHLDEEAFTETQAWIEAITGGSLDEEGGFEEALRNGVRLCALVNTIKPGAVKKVYEGSIAFKVMENLSKFNAAIRDMGVPTDDLFTPPDLYEGKDLGGVVRTLQSLGRVAQGVEGFAGPHLGAKLATETKRTFDEKTLNAGAAEMSAWSGGKKIVQVRGEAHGAERMGKDLADAASSGRDTAVVGRAGAPTTQPKAKNLSAAEDTPPPPPAPTTPVVVSIPLRIGEGAELTLALHEGETPDDAATRFALTHGCMDKKAALMGALENAINPAPAPAPAAPKEEIWKSRAWGHENMTPAEIQAEMADLKPKVLAEVNLLRSDPAGYADKLEALVPYYEGKMYSPPGAPKARATVEGVAALQRAIAYLRGSDVKPVGALTLAPGLDLAAQDSANNMRYSAGMGMVGKQRDNTIERVDKYGAWQDLLGEVTALYTRYPEGIVAEICICDGDSTHRFLRDVLHPTFRVAGVGCGPHPTMTYACAVTLAGGFGPKPVDKRRIVMCAAGGEPDERFMEVLRSVPDDDFQQEILDQIEGGCSVHLSYDPNAGVEAKLTDEDGSVTEYNMEWEAGE